MRTLFLFLLILFNTSAALSQATPPKKIPPQKQAIPTKNEIQSQISGAANEIIKQISDLKNDLKNTTDPEEKKSLEERISLLEKQVSMIQGLNKNISGLSGKAIQKGLEEESESAVPKKDVARINLLPKKILNDAELLLFIKNVQLGVEKIVPVAEKTEALNIYNETKAKYKSTAVVANAATGCWMLGHWEKALVIMGKACVDGMNDADNLNNYAAFLIMTGGEQAALPILEYLNEKYPDNSTILNNIGQAWYGLGDMDNATKYLKSATGLYPTHSMANSTLSDISVANNDQANAISELKASLKETYDPEKEGRLRKLGYDIKFEDMPPLNYPMENDPYGFLPLITSWDPNKIQSSLSDGGAATALQGYLKGIEDFLKELDEESAELDKKLQKRGDRLAIDSPYRREFMDPFNNSPAHLVAARSLELYCFENGGLCMKEPHTLSPFITGLWLPFQKTYSNSVVIKPISDLIKECEKIWFKEVEEPMASLSKTLKGAAGDDCATQDAKMDAFLAMRKTIYGHGLSAIQKEFNNQSKAVTDYIKYSLYADMDDPDIAFQNVDPTYWLLAETDRRIRRQQSRNKYYRLVLSLISKAYGFEKRYNSTCGKSSAPDPEPNAENIKQHKVKTVKCDYIMHFTTPLNRFELKCNTLSEEIDDPKLKKRFPDVNKGSGNHANRKSPVKGPIQGPRGPNNSIGETFEDTPQKGPLNAEDKDISQFSLEYNKYGNLIGFNFQLNEDGTALKDPDSVESGIDSRWSWNAIASPRKGQMNKLLMK